VIPGAKGLGKYPGPFFLAGILNKLT